MAIQLRTVNKNIASLGLELVKGEGYFYFVGDGVECLRNASVYTMFLNDLSLESWIDHAKDVAEQIKREGY